MTMTHWLHQRLIDRYFEGRLPTRGEAVMRARLGRCERCRARYTRHLTAEAALPGGDERALDRLWAGIRRASGRADANGRAGASAGPVERPAAAPSWVWPPRGRGALAGALLGAALVTLTVQRATRPPAGGGHRAEPAARGGADTPAAAPAIHLFRSVSEHAAEPVDRGPIHARDGLLFAYSNPDPRLTHLMVFAVDQRYAVHWYYPAYLRPGEDPEAVPIVPGTVGTELGEEIRQPLEPGPVRVYALFLREPHRVLEIEAMIHRLIEEPGRSPAADVRLPIAESAQQSLLLEVEP
jgi:hypothetical protein